MPAERIFADTNLFLRYLTNDIPEQAQAFERLLRRAAKGGIVFATTGLVLAEIVWTLESYYQRSKEEIRQQVLAILNTPGLGIEGGEIVLQAVYWYVEKNVDFIDAFHAAWMFHHRIWTACSSDRKHFGRFEGVTILIPATEIDR